MCGIAGVLRRAPTDRVDETLIRRMRDSLVHRGPDDEGMLVEAGHRRLSIIDLSSGRQPMTSADRTVSIVYNGEVYNYRALRALLESRRHVFRTKSDTEAVLQAYRAFGTACAQRLRDIFAFAIWDRTRRQPMLARDQLGVKPLYWTRVGSGDRLFASEIKALFQWPGVRRDLHLAALWDCLGYRYVPGPRTMFAGIRA